MGKEDRRLRNLQFLDREQAAEYIGMSTFWLEKHRDNPQAPRSVRQGRKVWYKRADLDRWKHEREQITEGPLVKRRARVRVSEAPDFAELEKKFRAEHGNFDEKSESVLTGEKRKKKIEQAIEFLDGLSLAQRRALDKLFADE